MYRRLGSKSIQSSPPFLHPILHAQCHWACLSLQTPSKESLREKEEKAGSIFEPLLPSLAAVIFGCNSTLKAQGKLSLLRRIPAMSKTYSWFPSPRHRGPASLGLRFRGASLSGEGVHGAWKKISSSCVRSHLGCRNERMEKGGE